jgi:hypothetical protein
VHFKQHPLARALGWSMTVVGVLGAMFLAVAPVPVVLRAFLGAASVTLGVALSWRASHMFVDVQGRTLTVHGWLRPLSIPVDRVTGVTTFPAVVWTDERGRTRWSPLWMLATDRQLGPIQRHNHAGLERLARTLHVKLVRGD